VKADDPLEMVSLAILISRADRAFCDRGQFGLNSIASVAVQNVTDDPNSPPGNRLFARSAGPLAIRKTEAPDATAQFLASVKG
jgi:hypothetical protein